MLGDASRLKPLLGNLSLSLGVSLGLLALLEGGSRALETRPEPPQEVAEYLWDWQERWDGDFYTMRSAAIGWPPWEEFNGDGLRDVTHAVEKLEGTQRLVFLGDSVTLGDGIEPHEAFPRVLQGLLDARGPGVEVFNVALWGWSTRQQRLAWEGIARGYRPDRVILGICLNDIPELQNNLARPPGWLAWSFARSALVRRVIDAPGRELRSVEQLFDEPDSARVTQAFGLFEAELDQLRQSVEASGSRLSLLIFPFRFQLEPGAPEPAVQRKLTELARARGLPAMDLLPGLASLGPAAFHDYDHLSPTGAERVAEILLDFEGVPRGVDVSASLGDREAFDVISDGSAPEPARLAAAWALGRGSALEDVAALTEALSDPHAAVRAEAARSLGRRLAVADPAESQIESLSPDGQAAVQALFAGLDDPREGVRHASARALWDVVPREGWLAGLEAALQSQDAFVRGFAAWSLGTLGERAAPSVPALIAALDLPEGFDRGGAATALGRIGAAAADALPALAAGLGSSDAERRWKAARALGRVAEGTAHASEAVVPLLRGLGDEDERVRAQAARALGRLGAVASPAAEALAAATRDPVESVRDEAVGALKRISG